jgi:hypothetical protein
MSNNIQIYNHQWENNKIIKENDNEEYLESINYMKEKNNIYIYIYIYIYMKMKQS